MSQLIYSPYSPFGALNQIHRELNRAFDDSGRLEPTSYETAAWVPHVDIKEEEHGYKVIADVPGVAPADVDITLDRNVLTIRGSRTTESASDEAGYKRKERVSGTFVRQFTLPDSVDESAIKARVVNGVLEVSIPKSAEVRPRSITVES